MLARVRRTEFEHGALLSVAWRADRQHDCLVRLAIRDDRLSHRCRTDRPTATAQQQQRNTDRDARRRRAATTATATAPPATVAAPTSRRVACPPRRAARRRPRRSRARPSASSRGGLGSDRDQVADLLESRRPDDTRLSSSSIVANGRAAMILAAVTGPMPGRVSSSSAVAWLMSIGPGATAGPGGCHGSRSVTTSPRAGTWIF